jgi:hypothetical protein
MAPKTKPKPSV